MPYSIDAIVVAAGSGKRLGSATPKAFISLGNRPLLAYALETFSSHRNIARTILVAPAAHLNDAAQIIGTFPDPSRFRLVSGGEHRWNSVQNGMAVSDADWVMVHDAARPFVSAEVIDAVIAQRERFDCVVTATPEVDTIRYFEGDQAGATVDRSKLVRVGTPQLFRKSILAEAFTRAHSLKSAPTDEALLMQENGHDVGIAWGDPRNFKITTPEDLEMAEALIARRSAMRLGGE